MLTVSQLINKSRKIILNDGNLEGQCGFCGISGKNLLPIELSDTFTGAEFLHGFPYICPDCWSLYRDNLYRNNIWFVSPSQFKILKHPEVLSQILQQTMEIPWACYTTSTYKKQGWIRLLVQGMNYSTESFVIGWDLNLLFLTRKEIEQYYAKAIQFQDFGLRKREMQTSNLNYKTLRTIPSNQQAPILQYLQNNKHNLKWQWILEFLPSIKSQKEE